MGYKEYDRNISFAEMEMSQIVGSSRTQKLLSEIDAHIDWTSIDNILMDKYPVGKSAVGNTAYPPLMLLKAVMLQKWFGIRSDPELENQINDRISFKLFIGLPLGETSPDHSVICRFRDRVGSEMMEAIHRELLMQLSQSGLSIDSGMAVDARLIKSASRPVSQKKLRKLREKKIQKKMKAEKSITKFERDTESDWTVKNNKPLYGMKEHAAIDVNSGLVLSSMVSPASEHDTNFFQYVVIKGIHGDKMPPKVYADKGYHGQLNREFLHINDIADAIMRKSERNARLTDLEIERNKKISKVRYKIEQYFGLSALSHGAGKARFTTLAKEGWDHLCGVMAFNIKRSYLRIKREQALATT